LAEQEFYSFDEALKQLRLKEEELKRLVSEGEIRAFREGGTMKLRRTDVESLRTELSGGEVVDLGDVKEELVFEDDVQGEAGMATQEISDVETILDEPVEDVAVTESPSAEGVTLEEESLVLEETQTEEPIEEAGEAEGGAEGEEEAEPAVAGRGRARPAPRSAPRAPEVEGPSEPALVRVALLLTALLCLLALPIVLSSGRIPSDVASGIASLFGGK
jgi:excisionase family DNA binding protein